MVQRRKRKEENDDKDGVGKKRRNIFHANVILLLLQVVVSSFVSFVMGVKHVDRTCCSTGYGPVSAVTTSCLNLKIVGVENAAALKLFTL